MLRCSLCDYTFEEGSEFADRAPGLLRVRETQYGDFLCEECQAEVDENLYDLGLDDEDVE